MQGGAVMNEIRVIRLIREMRCDPVTRWFEDLFGLSDIGAVKEPPKPAPVVAKAAPIVPKAAPVEGDEIESWLL
jgi:hypothetical protein